MKKRVGVLGSGGVGQALAKGFKAIGHQVAIGSRKGKSIDDWDDEIGTFQDVAAKAELIVLAVKGIAAEELVSSLKSELAGKTVIDTTNPIGEQAPEDGVLQYFTSPNDSLMERLQLAAPDAHFVKCFSSVNYSMMYKPDYAGIKPTMFICGNDESAKQEVSEILQSFDWEAYDMGSAKAARAIEPLAMLYCIPGILHSHWSHAFKLLDI